MKFLFSERTSKGFPNEPLLAATQTKGVVRKEEYGERTVTASKDLHLLKLVEPGDFVISLRSFEGGIELAHCRGIISPAYTVLAPRADAVQEYFKFFFKSPDFVNSLTLFVTGIREGQNIDYVKLSRAYLPLPPAEEQHAIAHFLEQATGRIEGIIRAKRKLISLLNEQKQCIISQAVTRGVDPKAPLKSSGLPWLGDIPKHWEVVRNLALFSHRVERGIPTLPVLQVSLRSGITIESLSQFGREKRLISDRAKYKLVRRGDLAYNTMRMWQGAVGVSQIDGLVSPAYVVIEPRIGVNPHFYELVFRTPRYKQQVNRFSTGIVSDRNRLYWENFKQLPNVKVPLEEQEEICRHIQKESGQLNASISCAEREIALLSEYRARLTADVVTGKLDVREAARNLPQNISEVVVATEDEELPDLEAEEAEA